MSGVSVGWFDPAGIYPNPQMLIGAIQATLMPRLRKTRTWPLAVSSIRWERRGVGVAYALVGGHIPLHIDQVGLDDSDGRIFQFVLEAQNRPALMVAPEQPATTPIFQGFAPPTVSGTFGLGGFELKAGQAVHFDITKNWHGITSLPVPTDSLKADIAPRAVIVQVAGFAREDIAGAVEHAALWIGRDLAASAVRQ